MDGMLSEEEINALLNGIEKDAVSENLASNSEQEPDSGEENSSEELSAEEMDGICEALNIGMGNSSTALSALVNSKVTISNARITCLALGEFVDQWDFPTVMLESAYTEGLGCTYYEFLKEEDVKAITSMMMGEENINRAPLSALYMSAIEEAVSQMQQASATALAAMIKRREGSIQPRASVVDLHETSAVQEVSKKLGSHLACVRFRLRVGEQVKSELVTLYPVKFLKELYEAVSHPGAPIGTQGILPQEAGKPQGMTEQAMPYPEGNAMQGYYTQGGQMPNMQNNYQYGAYQPNAQYGGYQPSYPQGHAHDTSVQSVQFQPFHSASAHAVQPENIDLIMDVPLEVTVELGRTTKSIKEILDIAPGTILELDKIAGEPIDVLVNGKFVARGEVVVIEESFGVRITEIVK